MASILPFIRPDDGLFDAETMPNMGEAFNVAVRASCSKRGLMALESHT